MYQEHITHQDQKKIVNLIDRLKKDKFVKSTLGGCIVEEKDNFILISKELKMEKNGISARKVTILLKWER